MMTKTTKTKWIYVPVLLTGVLGFGCRNNERISQPSATTPNSMASTTTSATSTPASAVTTPAAATTTATATDSSAASTMPATTTASTGNTTTAAPGKLNDVQIADVVKAANDAEIGAGTLAKTRAENPQVRAYAKKMIDEHAKNNVMEKSIMPKKSSSMAENDMSKAIRAESAEKLSKLQNMSGSAFDQAYIDAQVKMHTQLLSDLDNNYIPAAKDSKLKNYLKETRKHVSQHLESAQQVLTMINSGI